jgi:very-short-patch-repair endonuclease
MFKCPRCPKEFNSYLSLASHTSSAYNLKGEDLYRELNNITDVPTCGCGCGQKTKWRGAKGYAQFINGHNARGKSNPMYGKTHSAEARDNISQKRKEKFANGEYRIWQNEDTEETRELKRRIGEASKKENNPERAKKISKALKGRVRSEEHQSKLSVSIKKAWEDEDLRNRQRENVLNRFLDKKQNKPTLLEKTFANLLNTLKIEYIFQYAVDHRLYDFYLPDHNILIEVDGNFHHCNPAMFNEPIYESQRITIKNDIIKNDIAKENGYNLLRFWESDINDRPSWIVQQLLQHINQPY